MKISLESEDSFLVFILVLIFALILVRTAWVSDDAYITFRTVDNFIHGYGLTWNTSERVQTYTNPLWMFLVSSVSFVTREIFFSVIIFSILTSLITIFLLASRIAISFREAALGIVILLFSKAFVDYSTSGLENPLTHLLLAVFLIVYLRMEFTTKKLFLLSLIAAMATFNRMDTILLYLPALVYSLFKVKNLKGLWTLYLGFLPFVLWESFALFYYGFPFPNSAYAKLNTGISGIDLAKQGILYLLNSIHLDPTTLLAIFVGMIITLITNNRNLVPLILGIFFYIVYIIRAGGDFMSGRFLTAPFFFSVALITQSRLRSFRTFSIAFLTLLIFGLSTPYPPIRSDGNYSNSSFDDNGIADERGFYYQETGLLKAARDKQFPTFNRNTGLSARAEEGIVINRVNGYFGFYAGPNVHIVDPLGIGDPLLARVPSAAVLRWRIGHFMRVIPPGYIETLREKKCLIEDKNLDSYYQKLSFIIRGNLFSFSRLREILKMNLGRYNSLIDHELYRYPLMVKADLTQIENPRPREIPLEDAGNREFGDQGIQVMLDRIYHSKKMEISIDSQNDYRILYYLDKRKIADQKLRARFRPLEKLSFQTIKMSEKARRLGVNKIIILPLTTDGKFRIGHLKFMPGGDDRGMSKKDSR